MRAIFGLGLTVAVLALTVGCNKKDSASGGSGGVPPDGTYVIVAMEMRGEVLPEAKFTKESEPDRTIKLAGGKLVATKGGKDDSITVTWDSSKNPGHVTFSETKPGGKTENNYGIYKIEGDTLTICMADEGKTEADRPKEFKTSKEAKTMMMTLKKK